MEPVFEWSTRARPDRCIVELYDSDAYTDDDAALAASESQTVAGNGSHLYIRSLQPDIRVIVILRLWSAPQDPPVNVEETRPVVLASLTGELVINQFTLGPAGTVQLPQPGIYEGHASWTDRRATADYYERILEDAEGWEGEQFSQAWQDCPTRETYTFDLWLTEGAPR